MTARVLVACVGNIFRGDDGFGVEVAARLLRRPLPDGVRVVDFGIRSVHLAYELLDGGYDVLVLVDAVARQEGRAGTLFVIEPERTGGAPPPGELPPVVVDPHDLSAGSAALDLVPTLGGTVERILVVGVQPGTVDDGIGLSEPVADAVGPAAELVREVVAREQTTREERRTSC